MKEKIQTNITDSDWACDLKLRIDFVEQITERELESVDSSLDASLMNLGIGFGSARGVDFIEAALLDFGETPNFNELRNCVNETLVGYESIITFISYKKSEFTQASFDFIAEKKLELEVVLNQIKVVFPTVDFDPISISSNSPEHTYFAGSDPDETIAFFISEINYNQKDWIRFSVGCKRLNEEEIDTLLNKINQIHPNSVQIKWFGLYYNYETEIWELPMNHKLFESL